MRAAQRIAASPTGQAEFNAFNGWVSRYLAAPEKGRGAMLGEGVALAEARRSTLASLIQTDPRRAIENAVPPIVRQELPMAVVTQLEERVNEQAFFGVMGVVPEANAPGTPAYRREVRTDDGGVYRAATFGARNSQQTTERASIVGIAVNDLLAVDERPLRIVETGEIPNHPNNLTRNRTVKLHDEQGFSSGREVRTSPAPPREIVETCPISGQSTVSPKTEKDGAVSPKEIVVEAGGQFHYLCTGGHIHAFEEQLILREGGNGGPSLPTNPPTATQSTGYKTNLLMRVAFPEALKGSVTEKEGHDLGKTVQDWFVDSSYGAMTFMTTVTPLLVLPRSEAWYKDIDADGGADEVLADARVAAKAAGFDPANFYFDTVIYTGTPGSFGGQAYVGGKGCWLKSGTGTGVAAHEYGHNFGLWHANFWSTTDGSVIGGGSHVEYGDSFDTMGAASAGDLQFNTYEKNYLNWLPTTLVHDVTASGTYRIYQMDQPTQNPRQRYAIKTRKDVDRDYWIDLRQLFTGNAWVQGGVFLHWSPWASSSSGSHLLDTTPGSIDGKNDAPIVIGRTFSDLESGIHITPIAKNATTPPSADVVVNLGLFPDNNAPVVVVGASPTSVATNAAVTLTATASDPDGDVLSYAWDFGDKSFSTTNSPVVSKSWSTAGEYRVRCTASDMKGKTASSSVIITVGSPGTFRIAGTITAGGQPLQGVRVTTSSRDTYTDSDGTYTITGLTAGTYTLTTQLYGYTLTPTGSASATVGPNKTGVNFTATNLAVVSIALQDADCAEGANTGTFRISRTGSTAAALTVSVNPSSGSATQNTDYTLLPSLSGTFTIPAGAAYLDVLVTALDDTFVESFERATLELLPSTGYVLGTATSTLWIGDADTANPLVRLTVTNRDADESGDGGQFVIERIGATTSALNVIVALSGTATNGTDYVTIPTTITIPVGVSSVPVNVTPLQDSTVETMETVILTISTNAAYTRAASTADYIGTVNLHDDDQPILTVVATDSAAAEAGNDPGVFTITRTGSTAAALTVNYGLTGSALHGTDYVALPGVLTIPAGSSVGTVVITPIDDTIGEPAQTVVLQLRGGIGYTVNSGSNATVTIADNDLPYASIAVTTGPATENGTAGVFRVTTTGSGSGNINVLYTVTGTATNGTDFTTLSGTLSIAKNATGNINITPIQDALVEGYETVTITLDPDPAYSLAVDSSATLNLQDDDAPQVNVSTTNDAFTETDGSLAKFFVSRTGSTTNSLIVNYTLGGTATSGSDYTAPSGSVTIGAGATGAYLSVSLLADTLAEGTETIILNVTPSASYTAGISSATHYIVDSQSASVATQVRFSASSSSVTESAGTVNIPVTLSAVAAGTVTVEYYINGGTALAGGIDYQLTPGVLTFSPGDTSKNIPVTILDDTVTESSETLVISLRNPNNAKLGTSSHTVTITDNDAAPGATVGFAGAAGSGLESQTPAPLTVALSTAKAAAVTVDYSVTGGTATGGGTDYTITAGTLTFAAGETVKVIPNTITDDASAESAETIILTLANPVGAALNANSVHTYTITDDDAATVTIVATDASAAEPGTDTGLFTVTRTGSTAAALTVNFSVSGTAMIGADYANVANTVVIAAGASSATVLLTPLDDTVVESAETVILTLTTGVYTIGAPNSATVTIADNESDVLVTIVASDASAAELSNPGEFTVTRTGSTLSALTVNLVITGTATAGSDYTALATSVVIPAAASSVVIPVSPLTDSLNEGDETVIVATLAGSGYSRGNPGSATVTIANTDDGSPPTLASSSIVDDKGGASVFIDSLVTYTVTFNKDMDASTVTAADFGNAGSAGVTIGSVTETTPISGVFTVQAITTSAGTLQLRVNAGAVLKSVAGTNLDTTTAIADNTIITVSGYSPLAIALDTTGLIWNTGSGNLAWFLQSTYTHDGVDAAQSGDIADNESNSMETTLTGPGTLTFWWKVDSEPGYDYLTLFINDVEETVAAPKIAGNVDWVQKTVAIPSGQQTVRWTYSKDFSVSTVADAAWVDQVVFTPTTAPEIAVEQPVNTDLVDGSASISGGSVNVGISSSPLTFTVRNLGTADLTGLSVSKDGTNSADFTVSSLGASTLAPAASTTFTVTFSPSAAGSRTAAIHIASNDTDENPFDIALTGTGIGPGTLAVTPAGGLTSSGNYGGTFSPASLQYTLNNPGGTSINWTAAKSASWVDLDATGGTLAAGASATVTVTINSGANSLNAGAYSDTVSFANTTSGTGNTTRAVNLTVNPLSATVNLSNLLQTYDGSPKPVTVTTTPSGLSYSITYAGSATVPTNAGSYAVVATITEPNYAGSASNSLTIQKVAQTITFGALSPVLDNAVPFNLSATSSSGLAVSYTSSNTAVATVSGSTFTIVGLGSTTITASQAGDTNYNAATSVPQTLTVVRSQPLAVTGGPYTVLVGQTLSLNGSTSQPSYNETISTYEWDLNNDNTFGDVTGATPTAISYAALTTTWARIPGPNTIQLRVTDTAGKISMTSTTLTLVATLTWDANGATASQTDGAGAWLTANQWWTGSANATWSSGANAIFGNGGAGGAVTLASPTTVESLTFNTFTGTYTLGTAGQALTVNGGITNNSAAGIVSIISPVTLGGAQSWSNNSSGTLTVSGAIGGSGGFTKSGTGTVILIPSPDTSDYAGATIIISGVLNIQKATALGSVADGTSVSSGAALQIQGGITVGAEALSLNGSGVSSTGALRNISGTNLYGGPVTLAGATRINSDSGTLTLSNAGTITGAGLAVTFGGAGNITVSSIIGTTTGTVTKDGAGTLTLSSTSNSFSGGTFVNAGILSVTADGNLGDVAGKITLNGGRLTVPSANLSSARVVEVGATGGSIQVSGNNNFTTSGKLTGSGTLTQVDPGGGGGKALNFNATNNDFTGGIILNGGTGPVITVNSLLDSANNIAFTATSGTSQFTYGTSAIAALALGTRAIEINSAGALNATIQNNNTTYAITIGGNLVATGAGAKTLTLGAVAGPSNVFSGNITNGSGGGTVALAKTGAGTWSISGNMSNTGGVSISGGTLRLSGTNTYSGNTNFAANGVTLTIAGSQAASPNTTFVMNTNASSAASTLRLLDDGAGTIAFAAPVTSTVNNSPGNTHTFFVGNNNTTNGGTSSGTTTGSTLSLPVFNIGPMNTTSNIGSYDITGANGYRLQINSVVLNNANIQGVGVNSNTTFNPISANVTIGAVTMADGNALKGIPFLVLGGTSTDNRITGAISNAPDALTTGRPLNLTKANTAGVWTLSGNNSYSGTTTISGGLLEIGGGGTLGSGSYNGDISIASNNSGTFKYNSSANQVLGGAITGAGALVKDGAGALTITGPSNTYSGTTTVNGGKLFVNGSLSNAAVALNVSSGATLGGTGTIGRNVTVAAGGKLEFSFGTTVGSHDRLDISSGRSFGFSGASALTINSSGGAAPGTYTLITGGNSITGSAPASVNLPAGWIASVYISGNSLLLNVITDGSDVTLPILAGSAIVDDKGGVPITVNTLVTYTVTFSEDMDATSVTAADFGNAGSAAVTIGSVTETSPTSGVFTVQATPTTAGTLQLRVNANVVLKDVAGNNLDTTAAIADNTTLTVDGTAPTLAAAAIVDDKGGAPITVNTLVTYTVTFSEDMDASTVNALAFGNAGTSTVAFGSITETSPTSGIFTVQVTPTTAGTLQLKVNAGAILKDVAGNNLDTTAAIADNTTLTVVGLVDHFTISSIASPQTAGTPITGLTITALDASNNTATSFTGTVAFGGTGGFTGSSSSFTAGVLSGVSVTPIVAGSNLTLTVDDQFGHTGSVTIGTISPGNSFANWISNYPGLGSLTGFGDDPDGDGIKNGLENFFGTAPNAPNAGNARLSSGVLTRGAITTYTFTHPQNPNPASDVSAPVYGWSANLQNYYASGVPASGTTVTFVAVPNTPSPGITTVTATITGTVPTKFFVTVEVTKQ